MELTSSILQDVKDQLGIDNTYTVFDSNITLQINSALMILNQMGIGNSGVRVTSQDTTWNDFLGSSSELDVIATWVYLRVKRVFDPPTSSIESEAINAELKELEWRMYITEN